MKRRTRLIASGLTALAMTLSLGEAALASICAPELGAIASGNAIGATVPRGMPCCGQAEMRDVMTADTEQGSEGNCMFGALGSERPDRDGRDDAPCPFGPVAGAPGCGAPASLPSHTYDDLAASPENAMALVFDNSHYSPSFANPLFHPPKP